MYIFHVISEIRQMFIAEPHEIANIISVLKRNKVNFIILDINRKLWQKRSNPI